MGNCMRISRAHVVVHDDEEKRVEELAQKAKEQSNVNKRRKSVRFKVVDDEEKKEEVGKEMMMKKGHVVRIRVVVTQEELKQILNGKLNFSSKDEFLRKIKSASRISSNNNKRRLYEDGSNFSYGKVSCSSSSRSTSWRPVLESIQEEH